MKSLIFILLIVTIVLQVYIIKKKFKRKVIYKDHHPFVQLIESSKDVVYYYEVVKIKKFKYISPSIEKFLGEGTLEEAKQNPYAPFERVHPDDYEVLSKKVKGDIDYSQILIQRWQDNSGNYRWFEEYTTPIYKNGKLVAIQGIMRNIDDRIKLQNELEYRVYYDSLTKIYNREFFERKMEEYNISNKSIGIIVCDLDNLKVINDNFGHKKGDRLIKETAKILDKCSKEDIFVSRIGGDEFAVLMINADKKSTYNLMDKIVTEVAIYNESNMDIVVSISTGYAFSHHSTGNMERLFIEADEKMYIDKKEKKKQHSLLT